MALSSAEASLCCRVAGVQEKDLLSVGAGEKEKESARGTMGRGKREERLPSFPFSHRSRALSIFRFIASIIGTEKIVIYKRVYENHKCRLKTGPRTDP